MTDTQHASAIGSPIEDLDTPALLLDWDISESNLKRMAAFFKDRPCQLRPHFKNHKCATLARRQLDSGSAVGITCAKLGEAEVLTAAGFDDLLIANQVVGKRKIARLMEVAKQTRLTVAVDSVEEIRLLSAAAAAADAHIHALVEVDVGMGRCGAEPGQPALDLAREIDRHSHLGFDGIQAFEGQVVYINDDAERSRAARDAVQLAVDTRRLIESSGLEVRVVSGGSSSTYQSTGQLDGVDELQAGTYATMDWRYQQMIPEFEVALTVITRVISRTGGRAVLDVGVKGVGGEFGAPQVLGNPNVEVPFFLSEEHLVLQNPPAGKVGDSIRLISSHACTTCNLYREMFVHSGGKVVDVWPIEAAGRQQ
jgi:D-serine deaminase-like pyridoxal phosphate-dependent protein